jgi:UDP-4-amino-4,6-dideoxy-N-acetyl-beta-L-altrosamine transaminase
MSIQLFQYNMQKIPYGRQDISDEDIKAITDVLRGEYLTQGPKIQEFEKAFAEYVGCKYAVAVSNATTALHICTTALGVKNGDKVITTPITFAASANCVRYCGGEVVFTDIDSQSYLLDIHSVRSLLSSVPKGTYKGIIPVDFAGRAVNMQEFRQLADEYGLWIIGDACHSPGGYFTDDKGTRQNCGNSKFADLTVFSFHPVKHIATGEGGMITTDNEALYNKLIMLRTHGITKDPSLMNENHGGWYMEMQILGYNYRLTDFQAALGLSQIKRARKGIERRRQIAGTYYEAFRGKTFIKGQSGFIDGHAYHLYILEAEDRLGLYNHLAANGILAQIHYIPCHLMPYYKQFGWKEGDMPNAEAYYKHCISLPMYPTLTEEEQAFVIQTVTEFYG